MQSRGCLVMAGTAGLAPGSDQDDGGTVDADERKTGATQGGALGGSG